MSEFHVICGLTNASHLISGVKFKPHAELAADGRPAVITEAPVSADTAAMFKGIPGFSIIDAGSVAPAPAPAPAVTDPAAPSPSAGDAPVRKKAGRPKKVQDGAVASDGPAESVDADDAAGGPDGTDGEPAPAVTDPAAAG